MFRDAGRHRRGVGRRGAGEDLILARVLTLDGLEPGVNRGPGCDTGRATSTCTAPTTRTSWAGRSPMAACGWPRPTPSTSSTGSTEGDLVLVAEADPDTAGLGRLHFAGVAGSGMSALAQYAGLHGGRASGSDRAFDRAAAPRRRALLEGLGVTIVPQDGSGLAGRLHGGGRLHRGRGTGARRRGARAGSGMPVLHRSELLARFVARHRTAGRHRAPAASRPSWP